MEYCLVKTNPKTYDLIRCLEENETFEGWSWSVGARVQPGNILFIGLSGSQAGIYARATIAGRPNRGNITGDDLGYWIDLEEAKKERFYAAVSSFQKIGAPISEHKLRTHPTLIKVADWLRNQGAVKYLTDKEGKAIDRLLGI